MKYLAIIAFLFSWLWGMVLANGFWSTFFAIFFFPWGWYLVVERIVTAWGLG